LIFSLVVSQRSCSRPWRRACSYRIAASGRRMAQLWFANVNKCCVIA
jgi:hypothetical protein